MNEPTVRHSATTQVDAEELESTRSERFLAVVLTVFLLVGSIWFYVKVADWIHADRSSTPSTAQQAILDARDQAYQAEGDAQLALDSARTKLDVARTNYETAVSTGVGAEEAKAAYDAAQGRYDAAQADLDAARAATKDAEAKATEVEDQLYDRGPPSDGEEWAIAGIRLAFVVAWILASYLLIGRLRRRRPRYLPLGFGVAATGAILALVFATDYITDYIDPLDLGPIVLSIVGVAATIAAFAVLQRYLTSRIPGRRVRKGECPFCGYPVRDGGAHCEGCGREVVGTCSACGQARRIGSTHCIACGAA